MSDSQIHLKHEYPQRASIMVFSLFPYLTFQNNTIPKMEDSDVLQDSLLYYLSQEKCYLIQTKHGFH